MSLLRALRDVLANLRAGRAADAVRILPPDASSDAFLQRLQALDTTQGFVDTLKPSLPADLLPMLDASIAHVQTPITDRGALRDLVAGRRASLHFEIQRGGLAATPQQQRELDHLARLEAALSRTGPTGPDAPD